MNVSQISIVPNLNILEPTPIKWKQGSRTQPKPVADRWKGGVFSPSGLLDRGGRAIVKNHQTRDLLVPYKDPEKRRAYNRRYQKRYYEKNKARRRSEVQARRKGIRKWFEDIRRESECAECGLKGTDCPWLLDFHPRRPSQQENSVSYLV